MKCIVARGVIVTINDVRAARLCAHGGREWFARHGLDWSAFLQDGIPDSVVLATGDALGERAVEAAHERVKRG